MSELSKEAFIQAMVQELSASGDMTAPRVPKTPMLVETAYEEFCYDWPEVELRALVAVSTCLEKAEKKGGVHFYPSKSLPLTASFLEGLVTCTVLDSPSDEKLQNIKSKIFGRLFFTLPLQMLKAKSLSAIRPIFQSWDTELGDTSQLFSCLTGLFQYALKAIQDELIEKSTWVSMKLSSVICETFLFLIFFGKQGMPSEVKQFLDAKSESELLIPTVGFLVRDHAFQNVSRGVLVVQALGPYIDNPVAKWYVTPLIGQLISNKKRMSDAQTRGLILLELQKHHKSLTEVLKEYIVERCPAEQISLFMGITSMCKFIVLTDASKGVGEVPRLVELGMLQVYLKIANGSVHHRGRALAKNMSSEASGDIFAQPSWIVAHNFLLWYALSDAGAAAYVSKLTTFVSFIRSEKYATSRKFELMLWSIALGIGEWSSGDSSTSWLLRPLLESVFGNTLDMVTNDVEVLVNLLQRVVASSTVQQGGERLKVSCATVKELVEWLQPLHDRLQKGTLNIIDSVSSDAVAEKDGSAREMENGDEDGSKDPVKKARVKKELVKKMLRKELKNFLGGKSA